jgi:hydroxymethylglutaryl-CoA reductase
LSLHARQVAAAAGAKGEEIEKIARQMVAEKNIRIDRAEELLRRNQDT